LVACCQAEGARTTAERDPAAAGLSRRRALPLALGSVAGSGILFLPSAVYAEAGSNVLIVWAVATALCLPMLLMFADVVRDHPGGDGIEAFVRLGLGSAVASTVPILFGAVVVIGLPAGAMVAGRYVADALNAGTPVAIVTAVGVLGFAVLTCLAGTTASARLQLVGAATLLLTAAALITASLPGSGHLVGAVTPNADLAGVVLPGVLLAFWTFVGFENLTFLSGELRSPRRDFLPVSAAALGIYAVLTMGLSTAIAARIPQSDVDEVTGLLQLADTTPARTIGVAAVTVVAFGAMLLNAVAWVWGVSRLVADAAKRRILPAALGAAGTGSVPRRAILALTGLFAVTLTTLAIRPDLIVDAVGAASATFVLLYILSIVSYVRVRGITIRSTLNLALLLIFVPSLAQSGWRSVVAGSCLVVALAVAVTRAHRQATHAAAG